MNSYSQIFLDKGVLGQLEQLVLVWVVSLMRCVFSIVSFSHKRVAFPSPHIRAARVSHSPTDMVWVHKTSCGCWGHPSKRLSVPVCITLSQLKGSCGKNHLGCGLIMLPDISEQSYTHPPTHPPVLVAAVVRQPKCHFPPVWLEISRHLFYSLSKQLSMCVWKPILILYLLISLTPVTLAAIGILWYPISYRSSLKVNGACVQVVSQVTLVRVVRMDCISSIAASAVSIPSVALHVPLDFKTCLKATPLLKESYSCLKVVSMGRCRQFLLPSRPPEPYCLVFIKSWLGCAFCISKGLFDMTINSSVQVQCLVLSAAWVALVQLV